MTDQNSQFFAILTAVGEAKQANADTLGVPWTFAQMGVGDANNTDPVPSRTQTKLINERRRAPLNQLSVDPKDASIIIAEQVIPPDEGGWWIREIGLYDSAGDLVAVANCAPSYKPLLAQGTGKTQVVRLNLVVTSIANVQLKIDPAVVLATRDYVDSKILNVLPPNKIAATYTMVDVNERGVVQRGYRPTTLAEYGITDAMPKGAGGLLAQTGLVQGRLADVKDTRFVATGPGTADRPEGVPYAAGVHIAWGGGEQGFDLLGGLNGNDEFFVRNYYLGAGTFRKVWTTKNFNPDTKADKDKALAVGNVVSRQQPVLAAPTVGEQTGTYISGALILREAMEVAGTETREMFAPGIGFHWLGQIAGKLVMDSVGKLKWNGLPLFTSGNVASQTDVDAGVSDEVVVTPKKMRWGFAFSFGSAGYLVFPTWLGGLILQWSNGIMAAGAGTARISLPIQFPANLVAYSIATSATGVTMTGQGASASGIDVNARAVTGGTLTAPASALSYTFICIGK